MEWAVPVLVNGTDLPPLNGSCDYDDGRPPIEWATVVGWCVYDALEVASRFVGLSSILFWLFAQFPQIWENYKLKSASALSAGFLLLWTLGDSSYLISCAIRIGYGSVLATQLYQAAYFCTIDLILWTQFIWYNYVYPRIHLQLPPSSTSINTLTAGGTDDDADESQQLLNGKKRALALATGMLTVMHIAMPLVTGSQETRVGGRALLQTDNAVAEINPDTVGVVFAWICAALYLFSRVPQIYLNVAALLARGGPTQFSRQSVHGLALSLFLFAVMGNVTTVASIMLYSVDSEYLIAQLPYLLGSGGTLVFDAIIFVQFWKYRYSQPKELRDVGEYTSQEIKL